MAPPPMRPNSPHLVGFFCRVIQALLFLRQVATRDYLASEVPSEVPWEGERKPVTRRWGVSGRAAPDLVTLRQRREGLMAQFAGWPG